MNKKYLVPDPLMLSNFLIAFDYRGYQTTFGNLTRTKLDNKPENKQGGIT
jgi:hypothetical protein